MKDRIAEWWGRRDVKREEPVFKDIEEPVENIAVPAEPQKIAEKVQEEELPSDKSSAIELKVVRPEAYTEVATIADYLLSGCTVFLNMELLEKSLIVRMLDFLRGVTYATNGQIKKSSATTFIITPRNVDISEDEKDD